MACYHHICPTEGETDRSAETAVKVYPNNHPWYVHTSKQLSHGDGLSESSIV